MVEIKEIPAAHMKIKHKSKDIISSEMPEVNFSFTVAKQHNSGFPLYFNQRHIEYDFI